MVRIIARTEISHSVLNNFFVLSSFSYFTRESACQEHVHVRTASHVSCKQNEKRNLFLSNLPRNKTSKKIFFSCVIFSALLGRGVRDFSDFCQRLSCAFFSFLFHFISRTQLFIFFSRRRRRLKKPRMKPISGVAPPESEARQEM